MKYQIFNISDGEIEVCTPSDMTYPQWSTDNLTKFTFVKEFDTPEECIDYLRENKLAGNYTILPIFKL